MNRLVAPMSIVNCWSAHRPVYARLAPTFLRATLASLFVLSPAMLYAQGGPPMLTDDPDTPGSGHWEINTAYTVERTELEQIQSFPHIDVNYGLGERIQLKYETGWVYASVPDAGTQSGLDNSLLGVKWRFLDQPEAGFNMSVYPQLRLENSTGSVARGIASPAPDLLLPVEVSRDFGQLGLVGELGYQYLRSEPNQWVYGLLCAFSVSEDLELMSEVHGIGPQLLTHSDAVLNVGGRLRLGARLKLLASVGTGLTSGPNSINFIAYVGIQLLLGPEKK